MANTRNRKKPSKTASEQAGELSALELDKVVGGTATIAAAPTPGAKMEMHAWHESVLVGDVVAARKSS